jgi:hypothetical protein
LNSVIPTNDQPAPSLTFSVGAKSVIKIKEKEHAQTQNSLKNSRYCWKVLSKGF